MSEVVWVDADVTPFSHFVARRRGWGKGVCLLASHLFIHTCTFHVHAHNVSVHTVPIKCCRWNGASGVMEFELRRHPPQSKTMGPWIFQQGGQGRRRGRGKVVYVLFPS